jgi:DNA polymerase-3 subunit delta
LDIFLARLGVGQGEFGDELYSLWQTDSELKKLATFAAGKPVSAQDVAALVSENVDEDIFAVTNAIADRNRQAAVAALVNYMDRLPGNDEKAKVISISGALAEQFRGVLVVQGMAEQRVPDSAIAAETGYSPGKIFIYKKIAKQFSQEKLRQALQKLEILDLEMKTGNGPAALQFLMIVQSAMQ